MKTETVSNIIELFKTADIAVAYHDMLCGDFIGCGTSRSVYECTYNNSCVVKIETLDASDSYRPSSNMLEWEIWNIVKWLNDDVRKWFAPCMSISENGRILIQKKTKPMTDKQWSNLKQVPSFISDVKRANIGMYKGHPCSHDYAYTLFKMKFDKRLRRISNEDKTRS